MPSGWGRPPARESVQQQLVSVGWGIHTGQLGYLPSKVTAVGQSLQGPVSCVPPMDFAPTRLGSQHRVGDRCWSLEQRGWVSADAPPRTGKPAQHGDENLVMLWGPLCPAQSFFNSWARCVCSSVTNSASFCRTATCSMHPRGVQLRLPVSSLLQVHLSSLLHLPFQTTCSAHFQLWRQAQGSSLQRLPNQPRNRRPNPLTMSSASGSAPD